jgi:hypothetical protein
MSKPSQRKRLKRLARNRAKVRRRRIVEARRKYADDFPAFAFRTNGAPAEFVELVRTAVKAIDFRNRKLFHPGETAFFRLSKHVGPGLLASVVNAGEEGRALGMHLLFKVGHLVFSLIPPDQLKRFIPYHDVQFLPRGRDVLVVFRSLCKQRTPHGTIYYSRHRPTLNIDGEQKIVAFHRHAIERTCSRVVPTWDTYTGLGDAFAFFDQCVHFERADLRDGQLAFTFFNECEEGFFNYRYVEEVLGDDADPDGHYYYRIGYCPAVIHGDFVAAKTLLFPGQRRTPESNLVWHSDLPFKEKRRLNGQLQRYDANTIRETGDFTLVKLFHDQGTPQVIESQDEFYKHLP